MQRIEVEAEPGGDHATMSTVRALRERGARALPGVDAPRESELLLAYALGVSRAWLVAHSDDLIDANRAAVFDALIARRARGEPIAYLTGTCGFHSLELHVTPDVLTPRPETELLVELALQRIPFDMRSPDAAQRNPGTRSQIDPDSVSPRIGVRGRLHPGYKIADLGTGSGAIALAIAHARPHAHVLATEASEAALTVARDNAQRLGLRNVEFASGDWCAALGDAHDFDLIVSNPPYIAENDPHLSQGDLRFEPRAALVSGADGLNAIRTIVRSARSHLRKGGWLLFEHGYDQGEPARVLLTANGYAQAFTACDLENRERVSAGTLEQ